MLNLCILLGKNIRRRTLPTVCSTEVSTVRDVGTMIKLVGGREGRIQSVGLGGPSRQIIAWQRKPFTSKEVPSEQRKHGHFSLWTCCHQIFLSEKLVCLKCSKNALPLFAFVAWPRLPAVGICPKGNSRGCDGDLLTPLLRGDLHLLRNLTIL